MLNALLPLLRVCSVFYTIASRILYRRIPDLGPVRLIKCLRVLLRKDSLVQHVRDLNIDIAPISRPLRGLNDLLRRVLLRLPRLRRLTVECRHAHPHHDPFLMATLCAASHAFSLRHLSVTLFPDEQLASFLASQPHIEELVLRGPPAPPHADFLLPCSALPRLRSLRSVHTGPILLQHIISGRPVQDFFLVISVAALEPFLNAIARSAMPAERLTLMVLEKMSPNDVVRQVSERMTSLVMLNMVFLQPQGSVDTLLDMREPLKKFTALRELALMTANLKMDEEAQEKTAKAWHGSCPTLKSIMLPHGKAWFLIEGNTWTKASLG
ncbi:hypothetical protein PUNSTDRAFT_76379 [Punctularia strigosozonata HHB-11173 SS5]|uniref:F-box domain-containing protein n=1 Tax=Punctularia strigosozonata (strain HHB-11173) TaxID=741275 RepID=R7S1Y2_PUNST|nr:uncharacterized protein PUNSTDRAFT_76379 [Punctularia strigosozonata HHB-11173 SS5]EIN04420.1 hypothetical protein PUNSTDRAFT_76379 [Punctularia strigosozonata HHB-11173 SS5]